MIFISSLVGDINAEPSHWYEDVDVYSISDLVGVSIDRFENCLKCIKGNRFCMTYYFFSQIPVTYCTFLITGKPRS